MASSGASTPAIVPAVSSPTLWPATISTCCCAWSRSPNSTSAAAIPAATSKGWATAVSLISSALAVVADAVGVHPAGGGQGGGPVPDRRQFQPGGEEARGLGALARCGNDEHALNPACRTPLHAQNNARSLAASVCVIHTSYVLL